jgi:site-specific DNA recombinase
MAKKKLIITEDWTLLNLNTIQQNHKQDKLKWIIYLRVSTDQQRLEWHWIESQETNCLRWAKDNNVEIVKMYKDEWISGNSSNERKWFMQAIDFIKEQNRKHTAINYFICDSTSRFSRNRKIEKTYELVGEVHQTWAELVAVSYGGVVDTQSELWMIQAWFSFLMDSLESKRWQTRVTNWMRARILGGYWTFSQPPTWYKFETEISHTYAQKHKRNKVLVRKEPEATILSQWLEMFWDWRLISKQDLYNFLCERGMKSNSKYNKSGKLHLSIIDRLLDPQKLYVYAWYLIYPNWWINDLIEAKHPALISLDTMKKILNKLWKYKWLANMKTNNYWANANEYPLRWVLYCTECHKKMTWWASIWQNKWVHYYYGCNTKWCPLFKKTLRREQLHKEFEQIIAEINPPERIGNLVEKMFDKIWNEKKQNRRKEKL